MSEIEIGDDRFALETSQIILSIWDNGIGTHQKRKSRRNIFSAKNGKVGFISFKLWRSISTLEIPRTFINLYQSFENLRGSSWKKKYY